MTQLHLHFLLNAVLRRIRSFILVASLPLGCFLARRFTPKRISETRTKNIDLRQDLMKSVMYNIVMVQPDKSVEQ